ncbi:hypothetical protein [Jhaorihella thermophila]|uniref:Lysozyme inhibitor LprI N-terminal domain-containing protein n=1 Tax=Jhaorihella thermophila TaxID=488547 RepID=A0A1H5UMS1_9RHOB|nr:hypothetical protein [Jhaorihella thermophila]SEF76314.1 hypothetical protein SAMN05421751_104160 [Jhaorihella thermophila]
MVRALVTLSAGAGAAQPAGDRLADPEGCLSRQAEANRPVADCVNEAQVACFQYEEASPAANACFLAAKEEWGELIAARMDRIRATAPPEIAAIAGIEVKYDLRGNLMQCDRMEELALVREDPGPAVLARRVRCEATAVGLAYAKLWLQSRDMH